MEHLRTDMIDRYLQAVGFWLPRGQKQDILAELTEDLRSQIEDREAELGRPLDEADVTAILKQRGRPQLVAGRFLPQRSLIGPTLYPIYLLVLKIVALFYLVPWMLIWLGMLIFDHVQSAFHLPIALESLGTLWTIAFTQFGVITLVFAAIDRVWTGSQLFCEWDPHKLPKVKLPQASKRRFNALAGLIFGILGIFWLLAVPKFPFLILGAGAFYLKAAPIWHSVYLPILVLAIAGVVENAVTLVRPDIGWFRPVFRVGTTAFSLWIAHTLLQTRTYLLPVYQHAANAVILPVYQHAVQAAAMGNLTVLICVAGTSLGLTIALFFELWRAIRAISHPKLSQAAHVA